MEEKNNTRSKSKGFDNGRFLAGALILLLGTLLLLSKLDLLLAPAWLFKWQFILIAIGLFIGFQSRFSNPGSFILISVGTFFLLDYIAPGQNLKTYFWPVVLMVGGLWFMFGPRRNFTKFRKAWDNQMVSEQNAADDYIDCTTIFGGVKKNIISKDFKGGEVVTIFGGAEVNLTQADINGRVKLEVSAIMGGVKLIVPANWEIKSELVAVLGGIDDKRPVYKDMATNPEKVLVLEGTTVFGGIDIRSY